MKSDAAAEKYYEQTDISESEEEKSSCGLTKAEAKQLRENYTCSLKGFRLKNQNAFSDNDGSSADDYYLLKCVKEHYALSPEPIHRVGFNENEYITLAKQTRNLDYVWFFLHFYEKKLNGRIEKIISPHTELCAKVEQYVEIKMQCREYIFKKFLTFDETKGTEFTSYIYDGIRGAILNVLMTYSDYSFSSVDDFANFRLMSYLLDNDETNAEETGCDEERLTNESRYERAIRKYSEIRACSRETAEGVLKGVSSFEQRVFEAEDPDDEDGDSDPIDIFEAIPDLTPDRWLHDEYIGIIPAEDVYNAFMKLSYKEQRMIEKRLAICMQCKRVSDPAFRTSFEDMAIDFELKSPRAAEKIYRKALDEITKILIEKSDFDGAEIMLESRNGYGIRTKSAVYKFRPYSPESEFEWGTIEFDFTTGKTKVDKPFIFDAYETEVEKYIKSIPVSNLPKEAIVPFV